MKYRPFGNTGMTVSEIGFGANTISGKGSHGYVDESQGAAAVQRAYEVGVTFFDTAEGYSQGRSEEVVGRVLGNKDDVVVCTKVGMGGGPITADRIRSAAEASLSRLRRDAIDVYLLHNPSTELVRDPAVKEVLEVLQRDGLIRTYGVAILASDQLGQGEAVVREQGYSSMEITLNVAEQEAGNGLLAHAGQSGLGVIIRAPMGGGLLTGKYDRTSTFGPGDNRTQTNPRPEVLARTERRFAVLDALRVLAAEEGISVVHAALAWVLAQEGVSTVIPGAKDPAQAADNAAATGVTLSQVFLDRVRAVA